MLKFHPLHFFREFSRDERGSYLVEFSLLALPMTMLIAGGVELGFLGYSEAKIQGALREVARAGATGSKTAEELDAMLNDRIGTIKGASVEIERKSYESFGAVGQPEPLVSDVEPLGGEPTDGDCYLDINGNDQWDADRGMSGLGAPGDILYYGITVTYPMFFSLTSNLLNKGNPNITITSNAVIKNEPFGDAVTSTPETKCIT